MGELVLVNDTTHKLYQFHQKDLEEKRVLFIHKGVSYGRFVLFISDGKHYTSTLLEVSAQDPIVKVANNTGLLVQKGQMANLGISVSPLIWMSGIMKKWSLRFSYHQAMGLFAAIV